MNLNFASLLVPSILLSSLCSCSLCILKDQRAASSILPFNRFATVKLKHNESQCEQNQNAKVAPDVAVIELKLLRQVCVAIYPELTRNATGIGTGLEVG